DLLRDVGPLAEPDEDVVPRVDAPLVLAAEGGHGGVDDLARRVGVVAPGAPAVVGRLRALRAHDPAELPGDLRPLAAVLERVAPAPVEVHEDGPARVAARLVVVRV